MKKLVTLSLCLFAQVTCATPGLFFDGFMLGAAFGATTAQFNLNETASIESPLIDYSRPNEVNVYANSPTGLVSVGYSYQMPNNFVIAGAFTVGYTDAKVTDQSVDDLTVGSNNSILVSEKTEAQLTNDFALLFKPGYIWGKSTQFYGILGVRWAYFNTSTHASTYYNLSNQTMTAIASGSVSTSHSGYETGITLGLGIQQLITPRYSWSLEYAYTSYGNIASKNSTVPLLSRGVPLAGSSLNLDSKLDASSNTLLFYLNYRC